MVQYLQQSIISCFWKLAMCFISLRKLLFFDSLYNTFSKKEYGYTLIELLIGLAIIGILIAVVLPSYNRYVSKAQQSACLSEVKGYSNQVLYIINAKELNALPTAPTINACNSITDAANWTLTTQQKIVAIAKSPSNARIECDIPNGSPCRIIP